MNNLTAIIVAIIIGIAISTHTDPASAATAYHQCSKKLSRQEQRTAYHTCDLGTMPFGTGYNWVIPYVYHYGNHPSFGGHVAPIYCHMEILDANRTPIARVSPASGSTTYVMYPSNSGTSGATIFYNWRVDQYAGRRGTFWCIEPLPRHDLGTSRFEIRSLTTLRR